MKKLSIKIISVALAICLLIGVVPMSIFAEESDNNVYVDVTLEADKTDYADGDSIVFNGAIVNSSSKDCDADVEISLYATPSIKLDTKSLKVNALAAGEAHDLTVEATAKRTHFGFSLVQAIYDIITGYMYTIVLEIVSLFSSNYECVRVYIDGVPAAIMYKVDSSVVLNNGDENSNDDTQDGNADVDKDGVFLALENILGTSDNLDDSDGDGISDYIETYEIGSDPAAADSDEDHDFDGISNIDEVNDYKTSAAKKDTDSDGISDYQEIFENKTDPLKYDTDDDGVGDGFEIEMGTNPTESDTYFNVEVVSNNEDTVTASVDIELSGEQVESLSVEPVDDENMFPEEMPGYLGKAYDFNVDGEFSSATISFEFDESLLADGADPVICYFNEETQELEELETTITGNVASATVTHFSKYILIDRNIYQESFTWTDVWDSNEKYTNVEIILVIDDSGSLGGDYGYDATYGIFTGGKDPEHKRLEVARNFVDEANTTAKIGIVKFDGNVDNITDGLIECTPEGKAKLKDYLQFTYMNDNYSYNLEGIFDSRGTTYMYTGIESAFDQFSENAENTMKAIVVFTDGEAWDEHMHTAVVDEAVDKGIKIYTVGLGTSSSYFNNYLMPLANNTGGAFYNVSDAEQLDSVYENISEKIDIETDSDADGIPDYYEDNMICFNGVKLALDKNNPDTDGDGLLDGEEVELKYEYNEDKTQVNVTGKLVLGNPIKPDTDYDGISDKDDAMPTQNTFTGTLKMSGSSPRIEYTVDYRNFFEDNKIFNSELSQASLIFSSVMYENGPLNYDDKFGLEDSAWNEVIVSNHMDDVVEYKLNKGFSNDKVSFDKYYDDDISEVIFGHERVEYNGQTKEIIAVFVRGTNGTIEEWSSNFDIGDLNNFSKYGDWTNSKNHKGFDVTATRIQKALREYIDAYIISNSKISYWVTGHSRGAAIANIISANLIDNAGEVFAYTFATPNTTTDLNANASRYDSIFNYVNENDFVTYVPMSQWGFRRYGLSTLNTTISGDMEKQWEAFTGKRDYNPMSQKTLNTLVSKFAECSSNGWNSCHLYTCDCHGNKTDNSIIEKGVELFVYEDKISTQRPALYCKAEMYERWYGMKQYKLCQTPAYFMQVLAEVMAQDQWYLDVFGGIELGGLEAAVEIIGFYSLADKYESARNWVITAYASGIQHQHYTESYYIIDQNVTANSFK